MAALAQLLLAVVLTWGDFFSLLPRMPVALHLPLLLLATWARGVCGVGSLLGGFWRRLS